MQPVALTARQVADLLLLIRPAEVELRQIRARVDLAVAHLDLVPALAHLLIRRLVRIEHAALIDVRERHRLADFELAAIRLLLAEDQAEGRRLAGAVRADDADDAAARQ